MLIVISDRLVTDRLLNIDITILDQALWIHVWNDDVRWKTEHPHISATVQVWHLSLFVHTVQMPDKSDAKQILTASLGELEETTGTPLYYVDEDGSVIPGPAG